MYDCLQLCLVSLGSITEYHTQHGIDPALQEDSLVCVGSEGRATGIRPIRKTFPSFRPLWKHQVPFSVGPAAGWFISVWQEVKKKERKSVHGSQKALEPFWGWSFLRYSLLFFSMKGLKITQLCSLPKKSILSL